MKIMTIITVPLEIFMTMTVRSSHDHDDTSPSLPCLFVDSEPLELLEGAEADGGLGDAAIDQDRETAIQPGHPALVNCLPRTVHYALVLPQLRKRKETILGPRS